MTFFAVFLHLQLFIKKQKYQCLGSTYITYEQKCIFCQVDLIHGSHVLLTNKNLITYQQQLVQQKFI
ncbi:hypothetical protein pb186bvf_021217, partial [Paramecium bursaria]